jgi:hypothetical protein
MGATSIVGSGFYSVLRYRPDATRDEPRNLAVLLVDESVATGIIQAAPVSQVSARLHEQGLVDAILVGLARRLANGDLRSEADLVRLSRAAGQSFEVTRPEPTVIIDDTQKTVRVLYRALVAPRRARRDSLQKGAILDRVISLCRANGADVSRGLYVGDFLFDAVVAVKDQSPTAIGVLSFHSVKSDVGSIERDAGHYLFGLRHVEANPVCVLEPPGKESSDSVWKSHSRVANWLKDEEVTTIPAGGIEELVQSFAGDSQLPLVML